MSETVRASFFRIDALLRRWGPLVLVVFAVCYYGQYYRSGLNLGGEGGTAAVNAMRLNEGWLPIKDTVLNYNVMWFYPVAWLFQAAGPSYVALRLYFFALSTLAAVFGFLIVRRATGQGWLAVATGVLIVLIPGMLFRNYMGLLPLVNAWALLHAFVWPARSPRWRWAWFVIAGGVLGLTFLVRIDTAIFLSVIGMGLAVLFPFGERGRFLPRAGVAVGGALLAAIAAVAIHVPFYVDAKRRGFDREFAAQYTGMWDLIVYEAGKRLPARAPAAKPTRPQARITPDAVSSPWVPVRFKRTPKNWAQITQAEHARKMEAQRQGRPRARLTDLFRQASFYDAAFILALHLPILIAGLIIAGAGTALGWGILAGHAARKERALVCLVTLGAALTLFPQYFFFRPDTPHLSEFMIPFLVAMVCACFYMARGAIAARSWFPRLLGGGFVLLCLGSEAIYVYHSLPKESAGTIAASRRRNVEVIADNGVRVLVKKGEQARLQGLHDVIVRCSGPDDWVITYPYSPTINFMTNRRSYLKNLYIDNATAPRNPRDFLAQTAAEIERFQPAVIVIDQRDINDTEFSRFRNWAEPTYAYIRRSYVLAGTFGENEVYVRRDKLPPPT